MKILNAPVKNRMLWRALLLSAVIVVSSCASVSYSPEDTALQRRVQSAIRTSAAVSSGAIQVIVHNGVVTLHGSVNKGIDRTLIDKAARTVEGVISLNNHLIVL